MSDRITHGRVDETTWDGGSRSSLIDQEFTHAVDLMLSNDQELRENRREIVRQYLSGERPGERAPHSHELENRLKEWCEEVAGLDINENDLLSPLAREILSFFLGKVSWAKLAEGYIEEERMAKASS